jgi:hypothetical protein
MLGSGRPPSSLIVHALIDDAVHVPASKPRPPARAGSFIDPKLPFNRVTANGRNGWKVEAQRERAG